MKLLVTLLIFLVVYPLYSTVPEFFEHRTSVKEFRNSLFKYNERLKYSNKLLNSPYNNRPYDVQSYDLYLDWTLPLRSEPIQFTFTGSNTISIEVTEDNVTAIEFDAANMTIQAVRMNDVDFQTYIHSNNILTIQLPSLASTGEIIKFDIDYKFIGIDSIGFYLFPKDMFVGYGPSGEEVFTEERIAYTMSQPEDARAWMPCNDTPGDKARASITVKVPSEFTAASNGLLLNLEEIDDNKIYYWADTTLIPTYLMSVNASIYEIYSEWYFPKDRPNDSIEVINYVWASDLDNEKTDWTVYNAKNALRHTVGTLDYFSETFTPYPFVKYGHVAIQPFNFGGMEHQTISAINRFWLRGRSDIGLAHEIAHHWLGNLVTCENWNEIWFNEGGATWSEAVWAEGWGGMEAYLYFMDAAALDYKRRSSLYHIPIYGLAPELLFKSPYYFLVYDKSSWVYHHLRIMLGDDVFFPALRKLLVDYSFSTINLDKFKEHFINEVKESPIPLDVYIDQMLRRAGHPVYYLTANYIENSNLEYNLDVRLVQTNDTSQVYYSYVPIVVFGEDRAEEFFVVNDKKVQNFQFNIDFRPDSISIDLRKILADVNAELYISVAEDMDNDLFRIGKSIVSNGDIISLFFNSNDSDIISLELFDILGNSQDIIYQGYANYAPQHYRIPSLNSGMYLIKFINSKYTKVEKFIIQ